MTDTWIVVWFTWYFASQFLQPVAVLFNKHIAESYDGHDFITSAESATANGIAICSKKSGGSLRCAVAPRAGTQAEILVKAIAHFD